MNTTTQQRIYSVDILRGVAALMVVFFHCIQRFPHASDNILFHLFFSVQIPLFMLVSGYVTNLSMPTDSLSRLKTHIVKRLKMLLWPWFVWSVFYYLTHSHEPLPLYVSKTAYHMEAAFWFLFSLWAIDFIFCISSYLSSFARKRWRSILMPAIYVWGGVILAIVGHGMGMKFLGIQYTIYYMPIYYIGYLVGKHRTAMNRYLSSRYSSAIAGASIVMFGLFLMRYGFTSLPSSMYFLPMKMLLSLLGCFAVSQIVNNIHWGRYGKMKSILVYCGQHSLEIYVVHFMCLHQLTAGSHAANEIAGFILIVFYFIVVMSVSFGVLKILCSNEFTNRLLFGKSR